MTNFDFCVWHSLVICLLWGAWFQCISMADQGGCRRLKFVPPVDGKRLESHIFLNLSIGIYTPCEHRCLMESRCVSVNIGPSMENDKVTCELNDADHLQFPDDLRDHPGWTYRGTENPCSRNPCFHNGTCVSGYSDKRFICLCPLGYTGEHCERDIDECAEGSHDCHKDATCINTAGYFNCSCNPGHTGIGRLCSDIDECAEGSHDCHKDATCINTAGHFNCSCNLGHTGNGRLCLDIDECTIGTHNCSGDTVCTNTKGGYNCPCKPGFEGDGQNCQDIDECTRGTHNCSDDAVCNNTKGSHNCTCKPGFEGDGQNCQDVDECTRGTHKCSNDTVCSNTKGGYNCTCKPGFEGDGQNCQDIDECATGSHNCSANAVCSNTKGSYNCSCKLEYHGDGINCTQSEVSSCKEIYDKKMSNVSQMFTLTLDSKPTSVLCQMGDFGCGDGGWTPVMKIDGKKSTFHYDSKLWSNKETVNLVGAETGFDEQETKLPTYWNTSFAKICLGMKSGGQMNFIVMNKQASSLFSLIADGHHRGTSLGRDSWKNLIGGQGSLQPNCNREGFNVKSGKSTYAKARIGIIANNEDECNACDSRIGFGTGGKHDDSNTCGNEARYGTDNRDKHIKAMGFIFVQ